jgi:hypothetical protein
VSISSMSVVTSSLLRKNFMAAIGVSGKDTSQRHFLISTHL